MEYGQANLENRIKRFDWLVGAALFVFTLFIYLRTLAPTVAYLFDDSLEFQLLASRMAIAHPTGYPLYSILLKLATFLPFGDVAYRVNLVSALSAAGAVTFVYLAGRLVTEQLFTANNPLGSVLVRVPALIAALVLAFGETFWSQAVIGEVYALQALLTAMMLWLVLEWSWERRADTASGGTLKRGGFAGEIPLLLIAFFAGLMLTHHRMSVLLFPALIVYVLSYDHSMLRQPAMLLKLALAFALPLLLYLYLPIRGTVTSSLDGAYQNTLDGFLNWILGTAYTVFVTQNPFNQARDASYYYDLLVNDTSALGLVAAFGGFLTLFLRAWREWVLLTLALGANLVFVFSYQVADINVFFIPTYVILALFLAAGLAGALWLVYYAFSNRTATIAATVGAILLLLVPFSLFREHYARVDLSNKLDVIEYGRQVLAQKMPENATIIGILGEMTLLRYLQDTGASYNLVETIAADKEEDRFKAIEAALARGRTVFLTRTLAGLAEKYSLTSVGPLILVQPKANKDNPPTKLKPLDADFDHVKLLGYRTEPHLGVGIDGPWDPQQYIDVTLFWQPTKKLTDARLVSLKLLGPDGKLAGQLDRQPVLDAYPTNLWRTNEYIADTYRVPVFVGADWGEYTLQATMYNPESGEVYGQRDLERVVLGEQRDSMPRELLGVSKPVVRDLGGVELSGYDLDTSEPYLPGANIPITLLWRMLQDGGTRDYQVTVSEELGKVVATQDGTVSGKPGQYLRQTLDVPLPNPLAPGKYIVRVNVPGGLPFQDNTVTLGRVEVAAQ